MSADWKSRSRSKITSAGQSHQAIRCSRAAISASKRGLIGRAKAAGCSALVLTLDLQILGQRHKDLKNGMTAPPRMTLANIANIANLK